MKIQSYLHHYEIDFLTPKELSTRICKRENVLSVVDKKVYNLYCSSILSDLLEDDVYLVEATEENKSIDTALEICRILTKFPAKRNAKIIAIGGGIIQDICGFAANIMYRGIGLILVPTTLLAQADSCIGSKSSLNFKSFKNLLGTFYPPESVWICFNFLQTLEDLDYKSGLGEIIKFNVMAGPYLLKKMEDNLDGLLNREYDKLEEFVVNSLVYKKAYIEKDEFDRKERRLLNYAHTFGHAIETSSNYSIPHGIAVMLGMMIANRVSFKRGVLDETYTKRIENICQTVLKDIYLPLGGSSTIIDAVKNDKKRSGTGLAAVLLQSDLSLSVVQDLTEDEVKHAYEDVFRIISI